MIPEALEEELARREKAGELHRVKAIYVTSYFDNPSTVTLSLARRAAIVEIAKRWSRGRTIYVIDDAAYRELRYAGDDLPSLRAFDAEGDTVIVAETFSAIVLARNPRGLGYFAAGAGGTGGHAKGQHRLRLAQFQSALDGRGDATGPVRAARRRRCAPAIAEKLAAMLAAMDEHLGGVEGASGGAPAAACMSGCACRGIDTGPGGSLLQHAVDEGVLYVPGEYCYPAEGQPRRSDQIRLSFGVQTAENMRRGIEALAAGHSPLRREAASRHVTPSSRTGATLACRSTPTQAAPGGMFRLLIIDRYLLRQFVQTFLICFFSLTGSVPSSSTASPTSKNSSTTARTRRAAESDGGSTMAIARCRSSTP